MNSFYTAATYRELKQGAIIRNVPSATIYEIPTGDSIEICGQDGKTHLAKDDADIVNLLFSEAGNSLDGLFFSECHDYALLLTHDCEFLDKRIGGKRNKLNVILAPIRQLKDIDKVYNSLVEHYNYDAMHPVVIEHVRRIALGEVNQSIVYIPAIDGLFDGKERCAAELRGMFTLDFGVVNNKLGENVIANFSDCAQQMLQDRLARFFGRFGAAKYFWANDDEEKIHREKNSYKLGKEYFESLYQANYGKTLSSEFVDSATDIE